MTNYQARFMSSNQPVVDGWALASRAPTKCCQVWDQIMGGHWALVHTFDTAHVAKLIEENRVESVEVVPLVNLAQFQPELPENLAILDVRLGVPLHKEAGWTIYWAVAVTAKGSESPDLVARSTDIDVARAVERLIRQHLPSPVSGK